MKRITQEQFKILLNASAEHEHLEFKEANNQFNYDKGKHSILGYCIAIANEGGGKLVLGVTDKIPRKVVGTKAFPDFVTVEKKIFDRIRRKVSIEEFFYEGKRVLIFTIPSRPIGEPLQFDGRFLIRNKDQIVDMTPDQLKNIYNEAIKDFSAEILPKATYDDIDPKAIDELRRLLSKSGRTEKPIDNFSDQQLLTDLNLLEENKITVAALVLLGKSSSISRLLPYAEIRYGYRTDESEMRNQDTEIYQKGYLLYHNDIWNKINARNLTLNIQQGLFITEKKAFIEEAIREAINNAIIHRDYSENESTIIIQTQKDFMISNPGGLPEGITIENMIDRTKPRNKLIADVLQKCGFVETFGNGINLMYKKQLELGKEPPDYSQTDKYHVELKLKGEIKNIRFTKYVITIANELNKILNDEELRILYELQDEPKRVNSLKIKDLVKIGVVEKTHDNKFMLSKKYYEYIEQKGEYTRRKGLDKNTNMELILKHLKHYKKGYMSDFIQVLRDVPKPTINKYLAELKKKGIIELVGNRNISKGENRAFWRLRSDTGK